MTRHEAEINSINVWGAAVVAFILGAGVVGIVAGALWPDPPKLDPTKVLYCSSTPPPKSAAEEFNHGWDMHEKYDRNMAKLHPPECPVCVGTICSVCPPAKECQPAEVHCVCDAPAKGRRR